MDENTSTTIIASAAGRRRIECRREEGFVIPPEDRECLYQSLVKCSGVRVRVDAEGSTPCPG